MNPFDERQKNYFSDLLSFRDNCDAAQRRAEQRKWKRVYKKRAVYLVESLFNFLFLFVQIFVSFSRARLYVVYLVGCWKRNRPARRVKLAFLICYLTLINDTRFQILDFAYLINRSIVYRYSDTLIPLNVQNKKIWLPGGHCITYWARINRHVKKYRKNYK